jgi:hypothetical protein
VSGGLTVNGGGGARGPTGGTGLTGATGGSRGLSASTGVTGADGNGVTIEGLASGEHGWVNGDRSHVEGGQDIYMQWREQE